MLFGRQNQEEKSSMMAKSLMAKSWSLGVFNFQFAIFNLSCVSRDASA